jgi:hypothetical protein
MATIYLICVVIITETSNSTNDLRVETICKIKQSQQKPKKINEDDAINFSPPLQTSPFRRFMSSVWHGMYRQYTTNLTLSSSKNI